jgi:hypothetical protein
MKKNHLSLVSSTLKVELPDSSSVNDSSAKANEIARSQTLTGRGQVETGDIGRKSHNESILQRMKDGESLIAFDNHSSWFPPRPKIKKDEHEVKRLYSRIDKENNEK